MAKHPVTEVGKWTPSNLKFGIIVAVAILWAQVLKSVLLDTFSAVGIATSSWVADLYVAIAASIVAYIILIGYRKITSRLRKVKV